MPEYTIKISQNQAKVLSEALELYSRIQMGQLDQIKVTLIDRIIDSQDGFDDVHNLIEKLKGILFYELQGSYYSIRSPKIPESARIAYDIQQVLRHRIAWDENPEGKMTVDFDEPLATSTKETLPKITKE